MANLTDNQACSFLSAILAQQLTRTLSSARGVEWQVRLAEPPSATLPTLTAPVRYVFRFGKKLKGNCFLSLGQAEALAFTGESGDGASLSESAATALQELISAVAAAVPELMAPTHGSITVTAEKVEALDAAASFAVELQVKSPKEATSSILLHFDPPMIKSLAAAAVNASGGGIDKAAMQANLGLVMDVELNCTLRFGQRQLTLREILELASGAVVELDRQVDEPVDLILDGRVIARGEAVIIDGNYGLRVTQVVHPIAV